MDLESLEPTANVSLWLQRGRSPNTAMRIRGECPTAFARLPIGKSLSHIEAIRLRPPKKKTGQSFD